ncbi:MAG: hypothetical protein BroJett018_25720 [Chloroflexota bacterium]|nr:MAG: hypothetical protein BroJett018_25720 [Chloroflexota bacterium]
MNAGHLSQVTRLILLSVLCLVLGTNAGPLQAQDPTVVQNIRYYGPEVSDARLDLYTPSTIEPPFPTIVYITPMANTDEGLIQFYVPRLIELGYAVVSIRIRPQGHIWDDSFCGLAWVHANASDYGLDPNRIVAFGISGSGLMTATFATIDREVENPFMASCPHPEPSGAWVQGVVVYEGLFSTPIALAQTFVRDETIRFSGMTKADVNDFYDLLIETPPNEWYDLAANDPRRWLIEGFPLYWRVDGDEPPFLLIYGAETEFEWMPDEQAYFAAQLENAGVTVEVVEKPTLTHSIDALAGHTEEMDTFLAAIFGNPAPVARHNLEAITPEKVDQIEPLAVYEQGAVCSTAFGPDGDLLAATSVGSILLLDVSVGRAFKTLTTEHRDVRGVDFSPDGTLVATTSTENCGKTNFSVWDVASGDLLFTGLADFEHFATDVAFSPDGTLVAVGTGCAFNMAGSATVKLWDVASGTLLLDIAAPSLVSDVEFSPDGHLVAAATGEGSIRMWDVATGTLATELQGATGRVMNIAFSPDGTRLASAEYDEGRNISILRLWDLDSGEQLFALEREIYTIFDTAFSADGRLIAVVGGNQSLLFWDAVTGAFLGDQSIETGNDTISSLAFNQDGTLLATCGHDEMLRLWGVKQP